MRAPLEGAGAAVLAVALGWLFVLVENRSPAPLVPLRTVRWRTLGAGSAVIGGTAMTAFGMSFVVSQHAQQVWGYSPSLFGAATVAMPVMAAVGSYAAQASLTGAGTRAVAVAGLVLLGAGSLLLAHGVTSGNYAGGLLPGLVVFGLGLGASCVAGQSAALTGTTARDSGLASGLSSAAFQLGGAVGIAALATVAATPSRDATALTDGHGSALVFGCGFAVLGLLVALVLPGRSAMRFTTTKRRGS